jgi:hypothetical protein
MVVGSENFYQFRLLQPFHRKWVNDISCIKFRLHRIKNGEQWERRISGQLSALLMCLERLGETIQA